MISKYKKYAEYKDSGVEWLGEVPEHWEVRKLKYYGHLISGLSGKKGLDFDISESNTYLKPFIPFTNIANNTKVDENKYQYVQIREYENQNRIKKNDILFLMSSETYEDIAKSSIYIGNDEELYLNSFCKGFRLTKSSLYPLFLNYLLKSSNHRSYFQISANGFTRINLRQEFVLNANIIIPPLHEQHIIANFLDKKTADIDKAISQKEQMIKLLNERKQIVINNAVTRGLNPDVKLKDSGIDWIGEIPEHWEVTSVKYLLSIPITDGPHTTPELLEEGIPFISAEAVKNGVIDFDKKRGYISDKDHEQFCLKYKPQRGDIYMIKSGATTGNVAIVETDIEFSIWSPLAVFRPNINKIMNKFLYYSLQANYYRKGVELAWSFGTQQNIGMGVLGNLPITYPNIEVQQEISAYIEEQTSKISTAIALIEQEISLLKEYKASLIDSAVRGKICLV